MDMKHFLMNLEKPENQPMDEFLRGVKGIVESLVAIQFVVSDIDLIHYTLNALDFNYAGFVDALTHMPSILTFDEVRNKLRVHEQHIQFLH